MLQHDAELELLQEEPGRKGHESLDVDMKFQNIQTCGQTVDEPSKTVLVKSGNHC